MLRQAQHEREWVLELKAMIDNFALGLTHLLMMLAAILLLRRPDLDNEPPAPREDDPRA